MVEKMKKELDSNYEISSNYSRKGGEYQNVPMIKVKVDGELITPKDLFDYLQSKYKSGDAFIKQVIKDWVDGTISDDYQLSKNVALK